MNRSFVVSALMCVLFMPSAWSAEEAEPTEGAAEHRDWHFFANVSYTSRTLDGSIVNKNALNYGAFGDLVATGDSLSLDTSETFMYTVAAQYKKWRVGLNYAPTSFSGQGYGVVALTGSQAGVVEQTPVSTNIDVNLLLGKLAYDIIQTSDSRFGVGAGLGTSYIDLNITPEVGNAIVYSGDQPFGFLSVYMENNYHRFLYGFNVNAISATFTGVNVNYSDYTVDLGYRLSDKSVKWDVVGGYRLVNFSIDIEDGENLIQAITHLQGPFVGLSATY